MSLLSMIQAVCPRIGLPVPTAAISSPDPQITQLVQLCNVEGQELAERGDGWQALLLEATFTTIATEIQGAMNTIAPGAKYIVNDTIWNRTLRRPVFGPMSPQRWEQLKAMVMQGPWNQYQIRGGNLLFIPVPTAGQSCAFQYVTKNWVSLNGGGSANSWANDSDTALLDEDIMAQGLIWRWKAAKGFAYAEDYAMYERRVTNAIARDGMKDVLNMGDLKFDIYPGILIPSGSWPT